MDIRSGGATASRRGSADWFTGAVWLEPLAATPAPARVNAALVHFAPGARTHWHTHPLGQTLWIVSGVCRVQSWGGPLREARAGDVVWFPPGEKHWHGAAPATTMVHLAVQEALDGKTAEWLEPVSEEQYRAAAG